MEQEIINFINLYLNSQTNNRFKAFEKMREIFINNYHKNNNKDVAISLYAYLANWGMMHNSVLMTHNNFVCLKDIVALLYSFFPILNNYNPISNNSHVNDLFILIDDLKIELRKLHVTPTDTLVSKIILGTLGCMPAYDRNVKGGLSKIGVPQSLTKSGFNQLLIKAQSLDLDPKHYVGLYSNILPLYTEMRMLDMYLFI